ncbi:MAG: DNA (cytosine-5-)-methyltransferase, partial [Thermomicrobiales bacterium]
ELDLLVGGPPCQGFSGIGHRRTHRVHRQDIPANHLYLQMVSLINYLNPRMFLFENVRGLRSAKWTPEGIPGEVWADVWSSFSSLEKYRVKETIVFAKDYGVPQLRPRVLIVGLRSDLSFQSIEGMPAEGLIPRGLSPAPDLIDILGDLIDPEYSNGGATRFYPHSVHNDLQAEFRREPKTSQTKEKGSPLTEHEYSKHSETVQSRFRHMIRNDGAKPQGFKTVKFSQRLLPPRWGEVGPTITAASMPDDYVHFSQPRSLTVREWARLQTFPDWYEFYGPRTTGGAKRAGTPAGQFLDRDLPKYTQIGNAVPVLLARAIGCHFGALLDEARN